MFIWFRNLFCGPENNDEDITPNDIKKNKKVVVYQSMSDLCSLIKESHIVKDKNKNNEIYYDKYKTKIKDLDQNLEQSDDSDFNEYSDDDDDDDYHNDDDEDDENDHEDVGNNDDENDTLISHSISGSLYFVVHTSTHLDIHRYDTSHRFYISNAKKDNIILKITIHDNKNNILKTIRKENYFELFGIVHSFETNRWLYENINKLLDKNTKYSVRKIILNEIKYKSYNLCFEIEMAYGCILSLLADQYETTQIINNGIFLNKLKSKYEKNKNYDISKVSKITCN